MSQQGELPGFNPIEGGSYHVHQNDLLWAEVIAFRTTLMGGFISVGRISFRITDSCDVGYHNDHEDGSSVFGTNLSLKLVK